MKTTSFKSMMVAVLILGGAIASKAQSITFPYTLSNGNPTGSIDFTVTPYYTGGGCNPCNSVVYSSVTNNSPVTIVVGDLTNPSIFNCPNSSICDIQVILGDCASAYTTASTGVGNSTQISAPSCSNGPNLGITLTVGYAGASGVDY